MTSALLGIDVSNHQRAVDWSRVAADGYAFAFIKASEGSSFVDPFFSLNWEGARAAGLVRGAYHFARPSANTPEREVARFVSIVGDVLGPGDLVALDMEDTGIPAGNTLVASWALQWLRLCETVLGVRPVIYSGRWYMRPRFLEGNSSLSKYPLWLAAYQADPPEVPPLWFHLAFWQESSTGSVPGVVGNCDLNRFFGDMTALRALGKRSGPTPEEEWQNVTNVTNGAANDLASLSKQLADVRDIITRLRS